MAEHRWWTAQDLDETSEIIFPKTLVVLMRQGAADEPATSR